MFGKSPIYECGLRRIHDCERVKDGKQTDATIPQHILQFVNMVTETGCDINVTWSVFQCAQLYKNLSGSTNIGIVEI